jgi:hypothetical protein
VGDVVTTPESAHSAEDIVASLVDTVNTIHREHHLTPCDVPHPVTDTLNSLRNGIWAIAEAKVRGEEDRNGQIAELRAALEQAEAANGLKWAQMLADVRLLQDDRAALRAQLAYAEQRLGRPSSDHANWMIAEADIAILRTALEGFVSADFESVPPGKFMRAVGLLQAECREALARISSDARSRAVTHSTTPQPRSGEVQADAMVAGGAGSSDPAAGIVIAALHHLADQFAHRALAMEEPVADCISSLGDAFRETAAFIERGKP